MRGKSAIRVILFHEFEFNFILRQCLLCKHFQCTGKTDYLTTIGQLKSTGHICECTGTLYWHFYRYIFTKLW